MPLMMDLPLLPALVTHQNQPALRHRTRRNFESVPTKVPRTNDFQCLQHKWDVPGGQHFHLKKRGKRVLFDADSVCKRESLDELERSIREVRRFCQ